MWTFNRLFPFLPRHRYVWLKVRFLHETDRAILVLHNGDRLWLPKSRICGILLRGYTFEIRTKHPIE